MSTQPSARGVPAHVKPYIDAAEQAIRGATNRNAGLVVVTWDEYVTKDETPGLVMVFALRRSVLLAHTAPRGGRVPLTDDDASFGQTAVVAIPFQRSQGTNQTPEDLVATLEGVASDFDAPQAK